MNASASMGKNGDADFPLLCNGVYSPCKPDFGEKRILFSPGANIGQVLEGGGKQKIVQARLAR